MNNMSKDRSMGSINDAYREKSKERLIYDFRRLILIDSESLSEREMADCLKAELEDLGFSVQEDNVGDIIGGSSGNLYGILKGDPDIPPVLFSAHMDTVVPGKGKTPVIQEDGKIVSGGDTVLGADDVAGIVEILEGIRLVKELEKPHGDIEIIFSVCEEIYGKGASRIDYSIVKSKRAYTLDLSGPTGSAAIKAPSIISYKARIIGKAAHSGFEPEKGINALEAGAKAISRIKQGHIPGEMTVNVGTISSGKANNIVPEECIATGEVRGFIHVDALEQIANIEKIFSEEAEVLGGELDFSYEVNLPAFNISPNSEVCERFIEACDKLGLKGELTQTHGGSDNSYFAAEGIDGIVLSCGMYDVHSVNEFTYVEDLINGANLVYELV